MKIKIFICLFSFSLLIAFSSCNKDDDDSLATVSFSVKAKTLKAKTIAAGSYTFSKAFMGLSNIEFETDNDSADDQEFDFDGPFQINLLTGTSTPSFGNVDIPPDIYVEVEMELEPVLTGGYSIEIEGVYTDDNAYHFIYTTDSDEDFDITNPAGFVASADSTTKVCVQIDLPALFNGVDFTQATVGEGDIIFLNSSSNPTLAAIVDDNLDDAAELDEDD